MPVIDVDNLADDRLAPYRNLKDRELAREGGRFLAEGRHVVERLLAAPFEVESVFCARKRLEHVRPLVPDAVPMYVAPDGVLDEVVGFEFHSGVLAVGRRPAALGVDAWAARVTAGDPANCTVLVCPHTRSAENLGALLRIGAAFGVAGVVLGPQCTDPFWRRTIRVSMGAVFKLPLLQSDDLRRDLDTLAQAHGFERVAAVTDADAQPLAAASRGPRLALLLGSEDQGLGEWVHCSDRRVTIPMSLGTDSLNVAVAAAVFLYHFTQR